MNKGLRYYRVITVLAESLRVPIKKPKSAQSETLTQRSQEQDYNTSLEVDSQGGTCELQRAAQRALSRSQQRQTGVFGVRVLQTLHQRDGGVLHKLHQQLRRRKRKQNNMKSKVSVRAVGREEQHQQCK